jgi:hypothetical protein
MKKLIVSFSNFANAPENERITKCWTCHFNTKRFEIGIFEKLNIYRDKRKG